MDRFKLRLHLCAMDYALWTMLAMHYVLWKNKHSVVHTEILLFSTKYEMGRGVGVFS